MCIRDSSDPVALRFFVSARELRFESINSTFPPWRSASRWATSAVTLSVSPSVLQPTNVIVTGSPGGNFCRIESISPSTFLGAMSIGLYFRLSKSAGEGIAKLEFPIVAAVVPEDRIVSSTGCCSDSILLVFCCICFSEETKFRRELGVAISGILTRTMVELCMAVDCLEVGDETFIKIVLAGGAKTIDGFLRFGL